jgi:hypothetical protein
MNEYEGGKREGVTPRPEIQSFFSEGTSWNTLNITRFRRGFKSNKENVDSYFSFFLKKTFARFLPDYLLSFLCAKIGKFLICPKAAEKPRRDLADRRTRTHLSRVLTTYSCRLYSYCTVYCTPAKESWEPLLVYSISKLHHTLS